MYVVTLLWAKNGDNFADKPVPIKTGTR